MPVMRAEVRSIRALRALTTLTGLAGVMLVINAVITSASTARIVGQGLW
jgi:hypothetical protein